MLVPTWVPRHRLFQSVPTRSCCKPLQLSTCTLWQTKKSWEVNTSGRSPQPRPPGSFIPLGESQGVLCLHCHLGFPWQSNLATAIFLKSLPVPL